MALRAWERKEDRDQRGTGNEYKDGGNDDNDAVADVEGPRLLEGVVYVGRPAKGLRHRVGG